MRVYASAPPEFFILKGLVMIPEAFYAGLAALVFVMAGRSSRLKRRPYFKNLAFALGMLCIAAIALGSTIFAGVRVWASGENRRAVLELLDTFETSLAVSCIVAFTVGLSLRYTPAYAGPLLHRLQTGGSMPRNSSNPSSGAPSAPVLRSGWRTRLTLSSWRVVFAMYPSRTLRKH